MMFRCMNAPGRVKVDGAGREYRDFTEEPQTKRRWTTREAVLARIRELEQLPPIRTAPTAAALRYQPVGVEDRRKLLP